MQLTGMGQAAVGEPEALVEALRVENERIALPAPDAPAEIERVVGIALHLPLLLAAVGVDETPVPVAAAHHQEDALPIALLEELQAEAVHEHPRSALRDAVDEHRV